MESRQSRLEDLVNFVDFYRGKRVFITGHTGFKGSWLCLWLYKLGATVTGYALDPPTDPSLFELCRISEVVHSIIADVRDLKSLKAAISEARPEIVFHLAAQPLVRDSYTNPVETYETNVIGTVNVLEAVMTSPGVRAVVNVTTDKCYENREWLWGYREDEPLGGFDPYSSSKACSEIVTAAYRRSFFKADNYRDHGVALASARAGNVIGGGDWSKDRLIADCIRAFFRGEPVRLRNPSAIRPWQHVFEPLSGYLLLAYRLYKEGPLFAQAWNFGPDDADARTVEWVVRRLYEKWGKGAHYIIEEGDHPHEATYLKLECTKAKTLLGWKPKLDIEEAIDSIVDWTRCYQDGRDMRMVCLDQIKSYPGWQGGLVEKQG